MWPLLTFCLMFTFYPKMTSKIVIGWIQRTLLQMFFKFEVNSMKMDNFRNFAGVDLLAYVDLKTNHWLNSVTFLQMLFKFHVNQSKIEDLEIWPIWPFGLCWPQASFLVEFIDLIGKSYSNLKSIGWKLMDLEIKKLLNFWTVMSFCHFDLKNKLHSVGPPTHRLVKFCEYRFKIVICRRLKVSGHSNKWKRSTWISKKKFF